MSTELANRYSEMSRRLIQQAHYELEQKGDRVQASEKAAGAVAHAIKAIGEDRQWRHGSHNLRREIMGLMADEYGNPALGILQQYADELHGNFYEDRLHEWQLRQELDTVTGLLEVLLDARERGPNPQFAPSAEQQRAIDRLRLSEEEALADPLIDYPPPMPPFEPP